METDNATAVTDQHMNYTVNRNGSAEKEGRAGDGGAEDQTGNQTK